MTDLQKPVRRRTNTYTHSGRAIIIELRPGATDTIVLRELGRRQYYSVPIDAVYRLGARLEAERNRLDRKQRKGRH